VKRRTSCHHCSRAPVAANVRHQMTEPDTENREGTSYVPRWLYFPFAEQVFVLALLVLLVPGGWSIYLLSRGQVIVGVLVLVLWAALFGGLALFLHKRMNIRLWVSVPSALLVLVACVVAFFSP